MLSKHQLIAVRQEGTRLTLVTFSLALALFVTLEHFQGKTYVAGMSSISFLACFTSAWIVDRAVGFRQLPRFLFENWIVLALSFSGLLIAQIGGIYLSRDILWVYEEAAGGASTQYGTLAAFFGWYGYFCGMVAGCLSVKTTAAKRQSAHDFWLTMLVILLGVSAALHVLLYTEFLPPSGREEFAPLVASVLLCGSLVLLSAVLGWFASVGVLWIAEVLPVHVPEFERFGGMFLNAVMLRAIVGLSIGIAIVSVHLLLPLCAVPTAETFAAAQVVGAVQRGLFALFSGASDCSTGYGAAAAAGTMVCCMARFVAHTLGLKGTGKAWEVWFIGKEIDDGGRQGREPTG